MKEVSIYIATSIKGHLARDGWIGYALEFYPEGSKYAKTLIDYEKVYQANENRASQEALLCALKRLREKCILTVYTESEYVYSGFAGPENVIRWEKSGWKTTRGTDVKNKDMWQQLMMELQGNLHTYRLKEHNAYIYMLQEELKRKEIQE